MAENHTHSRYIYNSYYYDGHRLDPSDLDLKAYIDERIAANPPPSGGGVESVTVTLTNDDIKALPSTPFQVLPAPPAGKAYMFFGCSYILTIINMYDNVSAFENGPEGVTVMFTSGFGVMGYERCGDNFTTPGVVKGQLYPTSGRIYKPTDIEVIDGAAVAYTQSSYNGLLVNPMTMLIDNYTPGYGEDLGNFTGGDPGNSMKVTPFYTLIDI